MPDRTILTAQKAGGVLGSQFEGYVVLSIIANHVTPDLALGLNQEVVLNVNLTTVNAPIHQSGSGQRLIMIFVQDPIGGRRIAWDPIYIGLFGRPTVDISAEENTYSIFSFVTTNTGKLRLEHFQTGLVNQ